MVRPVDEWTPADYEGTEDGVRARVTRGAESASAPATDLANQVGEPDASNDTPVEDPQV
jgi:hypothetical protein